MNQKELKELVDFLIEKDISEFELERGDVKVRIKRAVAAQAIVHQVSVPAPSGPVPVPGAAAPIHSVAPATQAPAEEDLHSVKSPIVGTYYDAPAPGAPPFIKVGDIVEAGQVLCIIEAMKLMNDIESDTAGEIVKKLVSNGQAVEYGQPLFAIRPRN
jgi:acetyl-CoA carboxylase biotin carboxyl carrier protein